MLDSAPPLSNGQFSLSCFSPSFRLQMETWKQRLFVFSGEGIFLVVSTAWLTVMLVSLFIPYYPPPTSPPPQDLRTRHVPAGVSPPPPPLACPRQGMSWGWGAPGLGREACCYMLGWKNIVQTMIRKVRVWLLCVCEWRDT